MFEAPGQERFRVGQLREPYTGLYHYFYAGLFGYDYHYSDFETNIQARFAKSGAMMKTVLSFVSVGSLHRRR